MDTFAAAYTEFLKTIRENNPDAKIFCTLGIMGANLYPSIEYAVYNYTEETGDDNIVSYSLKISSRPTVLQLIITPPRLLMKKLPTCWLKLSTLRWAGLNLN